MWPRQLTAEQQTWSNSRNTILNKIPDYISNMDNLANVVVKQEEIAKRLATGLTNRSEETFTVSVPRNLSHEVFAHSHGDVWIVTLQIRRTSPAGTSARTNSVQSHLTPSSFVRKSVLKFNHPVPAGSQCLVHQVNFSARSRLSRFPLKFQLRGFYIV